MRARMRSALRRIGVNRTKRLKDILGYTVAELEAHLLRTIPQGYDWDDFLAGKLEIDHVREIWRYNYENEDDPEFRQAWALENLHLLTIEDHRKKSADSERERAAIQRTAAQ